MVFDVNQKNRNFQSRDLLAEDPAELSGLTFVGYAFGREVPDTPMFPEGTTGVRFERCNLDNVTLPPDSVTDDACSTRRFMVQNDLTDWLVDGANKATAPVRPEVFIELGISTDPADIPTEKLTESIIHTKTIEKQAADEAAARVALENAGLDPDVLGVGG